MSNPGRSKEPIKAEMLIAALLSCRSQSEAAERVGISLPTVQRWLKQPRFREKFRAARAAALEAAMGQLGEAVAEALAALRGALKSDSPVAVVRAADAILAHAGRLTEIVDLGGEVEALKARILELADRPPVSPDPDPAPSPPPLPPPDLKPVKTPWRPGPF